MWFVLFLNVCCVGVLFFCLFDAASFLSLWFVLELLSLSVVPHFVLWGFGRNLRCLLQYVVVVLVSSVLVVCGIILCDFRWLFISVGVVIKLGVFPFMSWVYDVACYSNWAVVWVVSGLLKVPVFLLFFLRGSGGVNEVVGLLCFLSFVVLSINFWKVSLGWRYCWCHMMLAGSASLAVVCVSCSFSATFLVYCVYLVWVSLVLFYFYLDERMGLDGLGSMFYVLLLISFPPSLAVIYKLVFGVSILLSSFFVFAAWCIYSISEQLFLVFYYVSNSKVRGSSNLLSLV